MIYQPHICVVGNGSISETPQDETPSYFPKYVTVNFENIGLGNVMWKIASAYGISVKRNAEFYIGEQPKKWQDISGFCGPFPLVKPTNLPTAHYILEKFEGCFDKNMFEHKLDNTNIRVGRYLQSRKYFAHCEDKIIEMFQPNKHYIDQANEWFRLHNINENDIKVCIHIRGGDMQFEPQTLPDNEWFKQAIDKIQHDAKIIIFSDDFDLVKTFPIFSNKTYIFAEKNSIMLDFTLMTCCNYFILSRGTFSWWAAFVSKNKKNVIYHDEFVNTSIEKHFIDYYPNNWELLDFKYQSLNSVFVNKPKLFIENSYDLINYYHFTLKDRDNINIDYINKLCSQANNMWKFNITHIEGSFKPIYLSNWTLSINNTRKLVIILSIDDNSTLEIFRESPKKLSMNKNKLYIFPAYLLYKCSNVAVFYAMGNTFQ